jgi:glutathione S-transferase
MALTFYYLSGSPFSWKVWLALEHKGLPYDLKVLSVDAGDLKAPAFLDLNPRGKVPVIIDDGFVLSESSAIIEYLEDRYAQSGSPLWPRDDQARARARRIAFEGDSYIYPHVRRLVVELFMRKDGAPGQRAVDEAKAMLQRELATLDAGISAPFLAGPEASAADYAVYPFLAVLKRVAARNPELGLAELIPPKTAQWMQRVEGLRFFTDTTPPHWRAA